MVFLICVAYLFFPDSRASFFRYTVSDNFCSVTHPIMHGQWCLKKHFSFHFQARKNHLHSTLKHIKSMEIFEKGKTGTMTRRFLELSFNFVSQRPLLASACFIFSLVFKLFRFCSIFILFVASLPLQSIGMK